MRHPRFTITAILIALFVTVMGLQASRLFRVENTVGRRYEHQIKYAWGFPAVASSRLLGMPGPRMEFRYYAPRFTAILGAIVGLAPSARFPSYERDWLVDWNNDGTLDLRIELERASNHPILQTKGAYIRHPGTDGWEEVFGQDADDVMTAVVSVIYGSEDVAPELEKL